jgi:hypothetical protein
MRRLTTLLTAAALLVGMLAIPAAAESINSELAELQAAFDAAQAEVDRLTDVVEDLETRLEKAEVALAAAILERDDKRTEVTELREDVATARAALLLAEVERDGFEAALAGYRANDTLKDDGCNNRNGEKVDCETALLALPGAQADVHRLTAELATAEAELAVAERELFYSEAEVLLRRAHVLSLRALLAAANYKLDLAVAERDAAQEALDAYVPVTDEHPGCKGVKNAKEQVAKNGKGNGKAAVALDNVIEKFECAA